MLGSRPRRRALPEQLEQVERALIVDALRRHHGDITLAARTLGLPKPTLYDKLRRLHIAATEFRSED